MIMGTCTPWKISDALPAGIDAAQTVDQRHGRRDRERLAEQRDRQVPKIDAVGDHARPGPEPEGQEAQRPVALEGVRQARVRPRQLEQVDGQRRRDADEGIGGDALEAGIEQDVVDGVGHEEPAHDRKRGRSGKFSGIEMPEREVHRKAQEEVEEKLGRRHIPHAQDRSDLEHAGQSDHLDQRLLRGNGKDRKDEGRNQVVLHLPGHAPGHTVDVPTGEVVEEQEIPQGLPDRWIRRRQDQETDDQVEVQERRDSEEASTAEAKEAPAIEPIAIHEVDLAHQVSAVHEEEQDEVLARRRQQRREDRVRRRAGLPAVLQIPAEREPGRPDEVAHRHAQGAKAADRQQVVDVERRLPVGQDSSSHCDGARSAPSVGEAGPQTNGSAIRMG